MSDFYKQVSELVKRRGGIVGPLQLWQVVGNRIVRWDSSLGPMPSQEELNSITIPDALFTAEQIVAEDFSSYQIVALQRFELALMQAGKPLGQKMSGVKSWLEAIMLAWSQNPTPLPASYFGTPPFSFNEASAEAVAALTSDQ